MNGHSVIILVADGARPDTLSRWMSAGRLPHLQRLVDGGTNTTLSSCFPSVTGPAYTPFLCGRHPAPLGLPGLRWYDRSRQLGRARGNARSYVGYEMRYVDRDLDAHAPTAFELVSGSVGALSVIRRGLDRRNQIGTSLGEAARTAVTHFRGDARGWLDIDRRTASVVAERVRRDHPPFVFAALTGVDKASHQRGHDDALVGEALDIADDLVGTIRHDAEKQGRWSRTSIFVVSDHGHSPVLHHEDLASLVAWWGHRVLAHPWVLRYQPDVAVMVSGNAMAHLYLELDRGARPGWSALSNRWSPFLKALLQRPSVDLALLPMEAGRCCVISASRGEAEVRTSGRRISYLPASGDPLGLGGPHIALDHRSAHEITRESDYPDSLVQISAIADASRCGDIVLSAARDWDFRSRYEPISHVSSHGSLHRDHILVPFLSNRALNGTACRTADVFPTALQLLGIRPPTGLDGISLAS